MPSESDFVNVVIQGTEKFSYNQTVRMKASTYESLCEELDSTCRNTSLLAEDNIRDWIDPSDVFDISDFELESFEIVPSNGS